MSEQSGINTDLGSACSRTAFNWAKKTFHLRENKTGTLVPTIDGSYSSAMDFNGMKIGISSDGIGTKIEIAERMQRYDTLGFDLVAMTVDDLVCNGFVPSFISNVIDVDTLDESIINDLMRGLYEACTFSSVVVTGGEIAELGNRISGYGNKMHLNWCATAIGHLHSSLHKPIIADTVAPGDVIFSVYNPGFRSNGYSLLRKVLTDTFGDEWHKAQYSGEQRWGDAALAPCLIYSPLVTGLLDAGIPLKGIAHITGGGVVDNLGRLIKVSKNGASLTNLFPPDEPMRRVIEYGNVPLEKAYRYWNMGNGLLFIVGKEEAQAVLNAAARFPAYRVQSAGTIIAQRVIIINTGDETLQFTSFENK